MLQPTQHSPPTTFMYERLAKLVDEIKHDTTLLHWDKRPPLQVRERCDILQREWAELPPTYKDMMNDFKRDKLYILVFASNKFEGSKISEGETMRLLRTWEGRGDDEIQATLALTPPQVKRGEPPTQREVLQHFLAAKLLCEKLPTPLTEEHIKHAHKTMMDGLLDDAGLDINPGVYRTENISARGHVFIPPEFVPDAMKRLVEDFNHLHRLRLEAFMLAGWLMAEFVTIHPFNDGNGRMCRLLLNYALRLRGIPFYSPITVPKEQSKHYMQVVRNYQKASCDNTRSKYGMLYAFVATIVDIEWENFMSNIDKANGAGS